MRRDTLSHGCIDGKLKKIDEDEQRQLGRKWKCGRELGRVDGKVVGITRCGGRLRKLVVVARKKGRVMRRIYRRVSTADIHKEANFEYKFQGKFKKLLFQVYRSVSQEEQRIRCQYSLQPVALSY